MEKETADPSTSLRSGRDDKGNLGARPYRFVAGMVIHVLEHVSLTFVIPTGA
jgi:hypothetical protein